MWQQKADFALSADSRGRDFKKRPIVVVHSRAIDNTCVLVSVAITDNNQNKIGVSKLLTVGVPREELVAHQVLENRAAHSSLLRGV
jgi:mRNA-degrading endonuclease toxin of MazEF toxin-antitoxin module